VVARLVAGLVASLALFAVASLADRLLDALVDGLVAGVPALFDDGVPDQLVVHVALLLAGTEATLGVATRAWAAVVITGAAVPGSRGLDSPEEADQRDQQRRSQAHPHGSHLLVTHGRPPAAELESLRPGRERATCCGRS
jgi:hypothetical protein